MTNLKNDLFLRALKGESVERPPVWLMRQAGRILPQYRAIRGSLSGFKELLARTDLAAEVTVQPVDELGVDAAIIFSDILVIPECMGLDYNMVEKRGPLFEKVIESGQDVRELRRGKSAALELEYVFDAIRRTKILLDDRVPGVNAIQIFDSWAGILTPKLYEKFALPYIQQICEAIDSVPTIVFSKGAWFSFDKLGALPCNGLGVDWTIDPTWAKNIAPNKVLQGNLDPCLLYAPEEVIEARTKELINSFGRSHIANLGHGVYPDTPLNAVKTFVNTVKSCKYSS